MNPERSELYVQLYFEEHKLEYKVKNKIYSIKLDKTHQKWYNRSNLVCTFDPIIAAKEKIEHLQPGNFIFDSMVARYADITTIGSFNIPANKRDLLDVNEKLSELHKTCRYTIEEIKAKGHFVLPEVIITTANHKYRWVIPQLILNNNVISAESLMKATFLKSQTPINFDEKITPLFTTFLQKELQKDLTLAEKEHEQDMNDLVEIQRGHAENQYAELKQQEEKINTKIREIQDKSMNASSFSLRDKYNYEIKLLKKKGEELIEKNKEKRQEIKELFDHQMKELQSRELQSDVKIHALALIEMQVFTVSFTDGDVYWYLPSLQQFILQN